MEAILLNALIDIVVERRPEDLKILIERHPDQAELFRRGRLLGKIDRDPQSAALIDLMSAALPATRDLLNSCSRILRRRLDRARALALFAHVVSALSSTGVIAALLTDQDPSGRKLALVAAVVGFVAATALLIARFVERPRYGERTSPSDLFEKLLTAAQSLAEIENELTMVRVTNEPESILELTKRANSIAAEVRVVDFILG